ncbi:PQQ-binding-like beta-propeller repeat protein [Paenibacillus sp.]|uniref:outer membrane protein assembly factor BamB family protein n=1 Tax=Paenibacillus sp. TaxID=58172 RepID=UPI002D5EB402|nr:stalk domain-containing protein [Paenibacillus sp.]HZG86858.1 stalk domain-containing protein [Paenibacillus sp.]
MYVRRWSRAVAAAVAAAGWSSAWAAPPADAAVLYEPHRTAEAGVMQSDAPSAVPLASPRWTVEYGRPTQEDSWSGSRIALAGSKAVFVQNGKAVAVELATGKRAWSFGSNIVSIASADGSVYALTAGGTLSRLAAETGAERWRSQFDDAAGDGELTAEPEYVYVKHAEGLVCVDADTGHAYWRNADAAGAGESVPLADFVLYATAVSGAITQDVTYVIDKATGSTRWRVEGVPLQVRDDVVYLRDTYPPGDAEPYGLKIDAIDTATGKPRGSLHFIPLGEGEDPLLHRAGHAVIDGDLVIALGADEKLYVTHLDASPEQRAVLEDAGTWIGGPSGGTLFFSGKNGFGLHARKLIDEGRIDYDGLDNPVSRLGVVGGALFAGQSDGEVFAFDAAAGKAVFRAQTDAAGQYGPFLVANGMLLVQAKHTLYAYALPEALQTGSAAAATNAPASARLVVDGTERRFEPSPVMIGNRMYVPLRALFQAVGARVTFDEAEGGSVQVEYRGRTFTLQEGAPFALEGGQRQAMGHAPTLVNGAVYVPLRDVGELLGVGVEWSRETRTVDIDTTPDP